MRHQKNNQPKLSLGGRTSGAYVQLNGFMGKIIGYEKEPEIPVVKFIVEKGGVKQTHITIIHRNFLKEVK